MAAAVERQDNLMNEPQARMLQPLRIGDTAPDFRARTTTGDISLSDFRGRWLVFFSHPADFTPVCTTEFVALAKASDDFDRADCALLGLSVDSLYSHLAWVKAIEEQFATKIEFPIVEDPSMAVGRAYGMIDDAAVDSTAARSTYFIDPEGVVRAITTYPHNVGRSVAEMLRLLRALQAVFDGQNFAPENWHPGQKLLSPPALTAESIAGRSDWFCHTADQ